MEHQRIARLNGTVAVATLQADGLVFVNHISAFAPDPIIVTAGGLRSVFDVCGPISKGTQACPERMENPLIPEVPELPTTSRAVLALKPDANSYQQDIFPFRIKMDCRLREGLRHPELAPSQVAALCDAMTGQSDFGAFLEDFVPDVTLIGAGLIIGTALPGVLTPAEGTGIVGLVGPELPTDAPLAPLRIPGAVQASEPIIRGISNKTLAVGAFAVAGALVLILFFT